MKNLILVAILLLTVSVLSFGQVTVTASTSVNIVAPIGMTLVTNMNFGNVATSGLVGTVILSPAGARTAGTGVTFPAATGTVTAASFAVTGSGTFTYVITLPASDVVLTGGPTANVKVNTFVSNPSGTGALTAGAQTLLVGATLNLPASTLAGAYSNASDLAVTVNYN
jgi:Domain of unknown function (DUF4402)